MPEVGDLVTTGFGFSVVVLAWREGVPLPVLARMLLNLAIDAVVGAIPLVGDLFDFVFKANSKNLALLEARAELRRTTWGDWLTLIGAAIALIAACALPVLALVALWRWL